MSAVVGGLFRYPVKSCRGASVPVACVEPWGLRGDRRWMVTDPGGAFATARTLHRLLLVEPTPVADGLVLRAPGAEPLHVATPEGPRTDVVVWRDTVSATPAGPEADEWLSAVIGRPLRLVHLDDPTRRGVDPDYGRADDRVSFADGYPLLLTTEGSLEALNALVAEGPNAAEAPLPMVRFRPNVVVTGTPAWAEDGWSSVRIGAARFRVVKPCGRCVMTTVDPDTAEKGREPLATLAKHRRSGTNLLFGMNLIPDTPGVTIRVGDEVTPT
ncbi:MOSC domain-containing protein [Pseudonocardia ailaonensis]|uniref:MOSC domain-containing protein n=1 Tax=Pseudonocardia ailaonensis TaxID=367279 RepID=A0ABN2MUX7_9PSEU